LGHRPKKRTNHKISGKSTKKQYKQPEGLTEQTWGNAPRKKELTIKYQAEGLKQKIILIVIT